VSSEAASPGLVLAGYTARFVGERVQVLGETEISYLQSLEAEERHRRLDEYFAFPIPCVVVTKGQDYPSGLVQAACRTGVTVIRSQLKTNEFYRRLKPFLEEEFAPSTNLHGSLADVFGVGLLFIGRSGIGKSECVLDLVERGHRLVADDLVMVTRRANDVLIGRGHELQRHYMEVRGIGLIDIPRSSASARAAAEADRGGRAARGVARRRRRPRRAHGLGGAKTQILDVALPKITVPLNPGKNITVIAEVIAMNHLLRYSGIDPAEAFNERLLGRHAPRHRRPETPGLERRARSDVRRYLQEDDE
jgi:HPr kinase/phosphorylase